MSAVTRACRASFVSCTTHAPLVVAHEEVGEPTNSSVANTAW
jgi:hypothetical protein